VAFQEDAGQLVVEERSVGIDGYPRPFSPAFRAPCRLSSKRSLMPPHAKGDRVTQLQYGAGTITDVDVHHTVIDFDQHGVRRFVTNLVQLQPTNDPAPPPRTAARRAKRPAAKKAAPPEMSTE
jgi:hypothetical protein